MATLEELTNSIKTHATAGNCALLKALVMNAWELNKSMSNLDAILNTLNVEDHGMGILAVLNIKLSRIKPVDLLNDTALLQLTVKLISEYDKRHVFKSADEYSQLCRTFSDMLVSAGQARIGIYPLCEAVEKLRCGPGQLTSLHAEVCRLCLHAKIFKPALKVLDDITDFSDEVIAIPQAKYILLYFYYGGMVYAALENYPRAHYFFEIAITIPATVISQIMVASYKKYILMSLMLDAKDFTSKSRPVFLKRMSVVVSKNIEFICQPYLEMLRAYNTGDCTILSDVVKKHTAILKRDNNGGLANQVYVAMFKKRVNAFAKKFVTVPIKEVAARTMLGSEEKAECCLRDMICAGQMSARICQERGMLEFYKPVSKFNTPAALKDLEDRIKSSIEIEKKISAMDDKVSTNYEFLKKTLCAEEKNLPRQNVSSSSSSSSSSQIP